MLQQNPDMVVAADTGLDADLTGWVESAINAAPNQERLQRQLDSIAYPEALLCFLHRFVLFNDTLAARVPFLAGAIHLTPNLFLDPEAGVEYCRQANGLVAAFVAEAASDEYRMTESRNMVHQHLSQIFLKGVLAHYAADATTFDSLHPLPPILRQLLREARKIFFRTRGPGQIFAGLGFHVGLEFFAHQEFNLVDAYLRAIHPDLVASLVRRNGAGSDYTWLALHTVVEIGHYRAGLQALKAALKFCQPREQMPQMASRIKDGFNAFVDLQGRFYEAILCDFAS